ncbi:FAD binding domain-containing protein [Xylariomycetidae sp. FL2044]|nr:FAD binding domain-containing protein [Xylariomycetidae sp. FL2044]
MSLHQRSRAIFLLTTVALAIVPNFTLANETSECYCLPLDQCWPDESTWDAFNATIDGRLIKTVPIGSVCHDPTYDEAACQALRAAWRTPMPHYESSSSVMETYWSANSCNPFASRSTSCELGNLVSYAVNVSGIEHILPTLEFVKLHNVRLVIRNTGHDFVGRSTGAGGLALWTHHLKRLELIPTIEMNSAQEPYQSYIGPAIRMGAGVQGFEASSFAAQSGLVVVGGWCPTVGMAGGYIQGGGHSPLGSQFGMAADQTLAFEVLTADGRLVMASPLGNSDLYWALSGGGPGTYGIVMSVTVRAYPDAPVGGATVYIVNDLTHDNASLIMDNYWSTIETWMSLLPSLVESGIGATYSFNNSLFVLTPLTWFNHTSEDVRVALKPWTDHLDALGIVYTALFTDAPSYHTHISTAVPMESPAGGYWQGISRLLPSTIWSDSVSLSTYVNMTRGMADQGVFVGGTAIGAKKKTNFDNAVLPAWRSAAGIHGLLREWSDDPNLWDTMLEMQRNVDAELAPLLKSVTGGDARPDNPSVGSYMNEAGGVEQNWQEESFGENYDRLWQVKQKWDPEGIFWGTRLVGSEKRVVAGQPRDIGDGRLCKNQ